jgi:multisite-specific tRNA:(cytosine-C5)-methyltransferase
LRSVRIYPHLQDTGGFFVAVLERRSNPSAETSEYSTAPPLIQTSTPTSSSSGLKRDVPEDQTTDEVETKRIRVKSPEPSNEDDSNDNDNEMDDIVEEEILAPPIVVAGDGSAPLSEEPKKKKVRGPDTSTFHENPYTFLSKDDPTVHACM